MKSILFAILTLSSMHVAAVDWERYHFDPQRATSLFIDLDSLKQSDEGFESDILVSVGQQEFRGRQAVNCRDATFRLWNLREWRSGQAVDEKGVEDAGRISANTAQSGLQELYCASWREPLGVRWKLFVIRRGESFFYDERVQPARQFQTEFSVYLKTLGEKVSQMTEVNIACRENRYSVLSGVYRDEKRGWLVNISAGETQTSGPDSPVSILRSMLCAPAAGEGDRPGSQPNSQTIATLIGDAQ